MKNLKSIGLSLVAALLVCMCIIRYLLASPTPGMLLANTATSEDVRTLGVKLERMQNEMSGLRAETNTLGNLQLDKIMNPNVKVTSLDKLPKRQCEARRIYIDMGANWANTLDLHETLTPGFEGKAPWEVYAFEASPRIMTWVEEKVNWLNDQTGPEPKPPIVPTGSTADMNAHRTELGCTQNEDVYSCGLRTQSPKIEKLKQFPHFEDRKFVNGRLDEALKPNTGEKTRYTFIPAAVSDMDGTLEIIQSYIRLMLGGVRSGEATQIASNDVVFPPDTVLTIDVVQWVKKSFKPEDCVFMKWDIEGAEHVIGPKFISAKADVEVDAIAWECHDHPWACKGNCCAHLEKRMLTETKTVLMDLKILLPDL